MEADLQPAGSNERTALAALVADKEAEWASSITADFECLAALRARNDRPRWSQRAQSVHIFRVPYRLKQLHNCRDKYDPDVMFLGLFSKLDVSHISKPGTHLKIRMVDAFIETINSTQKQTTEGVRWDWGKLKAQLVEDPHQTQEHYDLDEPIRKSDDVVRHVLTLDSVFLCSYLCAYLPMVFRINHRKGLPFSSELHHDIVFDLSTSFHHRLLKDIVKVQNQIPLFLIRKVFDIIHRSDENLVQQDLDYICESWIRLYSEILPGFSNKDTIQGMQLSKCVHLLGCLCHATYDKATKMTNRSSEHRPHRRVRSRFRETTAWMRCRFNGWVFSVRKDPLLDHEDQISLPSASKLRKSGVHFSGYAEGTANLVPKFKRGFMNLSATLYISTFSVRQDTELVWRNMIAFLQEGSTKHEAANFILFLMFMDEMIDTGEDVSLLRDGQHPVIQKNLLGTNKQVADLFNTIVQHQTVGDNGYGPEWQYVRRQIDEFLKERDRIVLLEFLRYNFGKPWLAISVVVGFVLLLMTFLQTLYTMLGYYTS